MLVPGTLLNSKLATLALKSFVALGGRDYGRIDIRLDNNGQPNFLEANLIPSLIKDYGNFPKACKLHLNLSYQQMIMQIIGLGMQRVNSQNTVQMIEQTISKSFLEPALT